MADSESRKRLPNLYIHIGLYKTGTSSIQQLLALNGDMLQKNNFLYPQAARVGAAHHLLAWSLYGKHPKHKEVERTAEDLWAEVDHEIKESGCDSAILSSEDFSSIHFSDDLQRFRQLTDAYNTKIVVFLRRQDQLYQSQYYQMVRERSARFSGTIQDFADEDNWIWRYLDYEQTLNLWSALFGKQNLIIRVYEEAQQPDGILSDFLGALGLNVNDEISPPRFVNPTLNRDVLEFLRYWNGVHVDVTEGFDLVESLDRISQQMGKKPFFAEHDLLSPSERREILRRYEDSNQHVARNFLQREDGRLFYDPWPDTNQPWRPYAGLSIERLTQITAGLWSEQQEINQSLKQQRTKEIGRINLLEQKIAHDELRIDGLHREIAGKGDFIASLKQQVTDKDNRIQELEKKLAELENRAAKFRQQVTDQRVHAENLKIEMLQREQEVARLEHYATDHRKRVEDLNAEVYLRDKEVARLEQQAYDQLNLTQKLKIEIGDKQKRIENLQNQIRFRDERMQSLEIRNDHLNRELDVLNGSISLRFGRKLYPLRQFGEKIYNRFAPGNQEISRETFQELTRENGRLKNISKRPSDDYKGFIESIRPRGSYPTEKKVSFVLPSGLTLGGVTTWSIEMSRRLAERNISTTLINHPNFGTPLDLAIPENVVKVDVACLHSPSPKELASCLALYQQALPGIFVPNYNMAPYAACALMSAKEADYLRVIGYCHTDDADANAYYYAMLQHYEPIIHMFVAVSQEAAKNLELLLPHRKGDIVMLPYGVNVPAKFEHIYSRPDEPLELLYAGRIVELQKRTSELATLAQELALQNVNYRLRIAGDGPDAGKLWQHIQKLDQNVRQRIILLGAVSPDEVARLWQTSDLCVLVSDFEGTSISMLEAMAQGCIPVVPQVSGTAGVIEYGRNGFSYPIRDIPAMARTIKLIDLDRDMLPQLGQRAHATILENYSFDHYVTTFIQKTNDLWQQSPRHWPMDRDPRLTHKNRTLLERQIQDRLFALKGIEYA